MVQNSLKLAYIFISVLTIQITGCSHDTLISKKLPLMSHVHIGHALSAWGTTPDEKGLFVVAETETQIAINESTKTLEAKTNKDAVENHLTNVLNALVPENRSTGEEQNYGAIRALSEAADHMLYASQSKDASENLVRMVSEFNHAKIFVANKLNLAKEIAHLAQKSTGQEQQDLLIHLQHTLYAVFDGDDKNQDGKVDQNSKEAGLLQLREIISAGLRNEVPAYHPVGKKYLLGLVRLPNGSWAYKFDASNKRRRLGYNQ